MSKESSEIELGTTKPPKNSLNKPIIDRFHGSFVLPNQDCNEKITIKSPERGI